MYKYELYNPQSSFCSHVSLESVLNSAPHGMRILLCFVVLATIFKIEVEFKPSSITFNNVRFVLKKHLLSTRSFSVDYLSNYGHLFCSDIVD